MKTIHCLPIALLTLALAGCPGDDSRASETPDADVDEIELPTEEDAEAIAQKAEEAAAEIDESNADSELDKLEAEIEASKVDGDE